MGVLALPFTEDDGGLGGSLADVIAVSRLLGTGLSLEPFVSCVVTVFDATINSVSAGFNPRTCSAKCVPSTLDTNRTESVRSL